MFGRAGKTLTALANNNGEHQSSRSWILLSVRELLLRIWCGASGIAGNELEHKDGSDFQRGQNFNGTFNPFSENANYVLDGVNGFRQIKTR